MRLLQMNFARVLLALVIASSLGGCKVTSDDIDYWKGTVKGPGKIVAVLLAERYPLELRTRAALALVEMERTDVNGVGELQRGIQALQAANEADTQQIVDAMVPGLQSMMTGAETAAQEDENLGPPAQSIRAKDAAYILIPHASPAARVQLVEGVVGWYVVDFTGRSLSGDYSVEQVVRSLGATAASKLVDALNSHMPKAALVKIAELVGQLGDDATKERMGTRLVELEREMETDEYLTWLKSEIRNSLTEQNPGAEVNEARVATIAKLNQQRFINEGALPAMKHLAGQAAVRARLLELAEAGPPAGATADIVAAVATRRQRALQALEGNATQEHLPRLMALALNDANPIQVRDYAFDRVGDIRSADAIPQLWPMFQEAGNDQLKKRLRWRAGELILAIGGTSIIGEFLSKLPTDRETEYEPEELAGYATRMSQMTPPPTDLMRRQLSSNNWFARVIALRFLERRGVEADAAAMQRLVRDDTAVLGTAWSRMDPAIDKVGKVAEAAIAALRERLAQPEPAAAAAAPEAPAAPTPAE